MLKKSLVIALSASMIFGTCTPAFAAGKEDAQIMSSNQKTDPTVTVDELLKQLNSMDFGREVTFTALPQSRLNNQELLSFDSVEAAELFLKQFISARRDLTIPTVLSEQNQLQTPVIANVMESRSGWHSNTVKWWGGGNTSLLSFTNAEINFYYGNGRVSNITVKNSYMTGIVGATWTHRHGTGTSTGGKNATFSVTGTWFIGLNIYGFPIGASFNETLNSPVITLTV